MTAARICTFVLLSLSALTANADTVIVDQIDKAFLIEGQPVETLKVKAGTTVSFRNGDPFFHNIFSLSDLKIFDLGSYPEGESKEVTLDEPGTIEVECAIHPDMFMTIEIE